MFFAYSRDTCNATPHYNLLGILKFENVYKFRKPMLLWSLSIFYFDYFLFLINIISINTVKVIIYVNSVKQ